MVLTILILKRLIHGHSGITRHISLVSPHLPLSKYGLSGRYAWKRNGGNVLNLLLCVMDAGRYAWKRNGGNVLNLLLCVMDASAGCNVVMTLMTSLKTSRLAVMGSSERTAIALESQAV